MSECNARGKDAHAYHGLGGLLLEDKNTEDGKGKGADVAGNGAGVQRLLRLHNAETRIEDETQERRQEATHWMVELTGVWR